jgi:hypothetical protein
VRGWNFPLLEQRDRQPSVAPSGHRSRKVASRGQTNQSGRGGVTAPVEVGRVKR